MWIKHIANLSTILMDTNHIQKRCLHSCTERLITNFRQKIYIAENSGAEWLAVSHLKVNEAIFWLGHSMIFRWCMWHLLSCHGWISLMVLLHVPIKRIMSKSNSHWSGQENAWNRIGIKPATFCTSVISHLLARPLKTMTAAWKSIRFCVYCFTSWLVLFCIL